MTISSQAQVHVSDQAFTLAPLEPHKVILHKVFACDIPVVVIVFFLHDLCIFCALWIKQSVTGTIKTEHLKPLLVRGSSDNDVVHLDAFIHFFQPQF